MRGMPEDRALRDVKAAVVFLRARPDIRQKDIGSIGWCFGGEYALVAALNVKALGAAVICYGRLVTEKSEIEKISCPLLLINGAEDRGIPPSVVKQFVQKAKSLNKDVSSALEDAGHAFMNPNNRSGFRREDSQNAWEQIDQFFAKHLKH